MRVFDYRNKQHELDNKQPSVKVKMLYSIVELEDGSRGTYVNGVLQSIDDMPSLIRPDGTKMWHDRGLLNRKNLFAVEHADGTVGWFKNDKLHRDEDLPAVSAPDGYMAYYKNGVLHRERGPAVKHPSGSVEYWLGGEKITKEEHQLYCEETKRIPSGFRKKQCLELVTEPELPIFGE